MADVRVMFHCSYVDVEGADVRVRPPRPHLFHCSDVVVEGAYVRVMFHCSDVDVEGPDVRVLCFIVATLMSRGPMYVYALHDRICAVPVKRTMKTTKDEPNDFCFFNSSSKAYRWGILLLIIIIKIIKRKIHRIGAPNRYAFISKIITKKIKLLNLKIQVKCQNLV